MVTVTIYVVVQTSSVDVVDALSGKRRLVKVTNGSGITGRGDRFARPGTPG